MTNYPRFATSSVLAGMAALIAITLPLALNGCGGSGGSLFNGSGQGASAFKLVSCSLGGAPCGTATNVVQQTQSLSFTFNDSISPGSVTSETLQILEVDPGGGGGAEPPGIRTVAGNIVTFTPEVSFDSNGNVSYGFKPGRTYRITIPESPSTAIKSASGKANTTSITATIFVSNQLADINPGPPAASLTVPLSQTNAPLSTPVEVTFNDIMNVATLVNKLQGTSQTLSVFVDLDGDLQTTNDQIAQTGSWDVNFDSEKKQTTVRFTHPAPFPSPGPSGTRTIVVSLNAVVIKDLGGNPLGGPSVFSFRTAVCNIQNNFSIAEEFTNNANEETAETGNNMWNGSGGAGLLVRGTGGGSGTHGAFIGDTFLSVDTIGAIATDGTSVAADANFNSPGRIPFVAKSVDALPALNQNTSVPITVTDGVFQFSTFQINPGVRVRFEGAAPARIFVRGNVNIQGTLDAGGGDGSRSVSDDDKRKFTGINTPCTSKNVSDPININGWGGGATGCPTFPQFVIGKPGGRGGPQGGNGGNGGDLPTNLPAYPLASAVLFTSFEGQNGVAPPQFPGSGGPLPTGGTGTRAVPVFTVSGTNVYANNVAVSVGSGINYDSCAVVGCSNLNANLCEGIVGHPTGAQPTAYSVQMGAPAPGGASNVEDGTIGTWCQEAAPTATCGAGGAAKKAVPDWAAVSVTGGPALSPPAKSDAIPFYPMPPTGTPGGRAIASEPANFGSDGLGNFSMLRGGAGGGGTGVNAFGTGGSFNSAAPNFGTTVSGLFSVGCGGGAGGGALQVQAGRNLTVAAGGFIRANGGDGGDHLDHPTCTATPACGTTLDNFTAGKLWGQSMAPAGAGGGGSVLLQVSNTLSLANASVSVRGGVGGDGRVLPVAFVAKFVFPAIATNVPIRLRGGDGGNGRWHYQTIGAVNADAGFDPPQASNKTSPFNGINIASADFSGAQSKWLSFPPTAGSFVQLTGYDLTISTTGGTQVLTQNDITQNAVLTASFASGGTLPVRILFQGTRPDAFGQPDPLARTPWTDQVSTLSVASPKFVRFAVVFSRQAAAANPSFLGIDKIDIKGSGENCPN